MAERRQVRLGARLDDVGRKPVTGEELVADPNPHVHLALCVLAWRDRLHVIVLERPLDGAAAEVVARRFPVERVTLVDFSPPMLARARERFAGSPVSVNIVDADLGDPGWREHLPDDVPVYDLVVSRYAIHHLPHERKHALYAEIHNLLAPGGLFCNIEHVSSVSPVYTDIFERLIINGMVATSDGSLDIEAATAAFQARQDAQTNILAPAEDQCAWLREIGFVDVDVVMKVFELAVIVARRADA